MAFASTVALGGIAALADTEAGIVAGIVALAASALVAKESSPPFPPQSTEASSEPA